MAPTMTYETFDPATGGYKEGAAENPYLLQIEADFYAASERGDSDEELQALVDRKAAVEPHADDVDAAKEAYFSTLAE
jgi:hypothetical protein